MDFFGSAFDFLDNAAQSVGDFFSGASGVAGNANSLTDFFGNSQDAADLGTGTDAIAGDTVNPQVNFADSQGGIGSALGAGITGVSKALGAFNTAGSTAKQLSRSFALPGQNKEVMGYDKDSNPAKTPGLKSQDPREAAAYWHSLMQSYTYGGK